MNQYCRYCGYCFDGDAPFCTAKEKVLSESELKRQNRCKDFWLSEFGDMLTGRQYKPRCRSEIEQIKMEEEK